MDLGYFETSLDVADIAQSLDFYQKLGFSLVDGGVDIRNVTVELGDCRLGLYQGYLEPARTQLIFWQGDIEVIAADLAGKGVVFEKGPTRDENGAGFHLRDPDDHPLHFINLPVYFYNQPGHERAAPAYKPSRPKPADPRMGHFELSLVVRDVGRAHDFYRKLGFELAQTNDQGRSVTLRSGDCRLGLFQGVLDPAETQLIFYQGEIEAVVCDLAAHGVSLARPLMMDGKGGLGAHFRDPDGHAIYLNYEPA